MSNFMNEVYNDGFAPEFSVWMLKETIVLVWDYVYETLFSKFCWIAKPPKGKGGAHHVS